MIRTLALLPSPRSYDVVTALTLTRFPGVPVNWVTGANGQESAAIYTDTPPDPAAVAAWQTDVTNHDPNAPTTASNAAALRASAQAALTTNATFLGTVAARRTAIANGKSTAQTGTTAVVSNVAAAQTQIRSIWSTLVQIATALDDLNNDAESITKQNNGVIRLLLNAFDSTAGT